MNEFGFGTINNQIPGIGQPVMVHMKPSRDTPNEDSFYKRVGFENVSVIPGENGINYNEKKGDDGSRDDKGVFWNDDAR